MARISAKSKDFRENLFGDRANFNPIERKLFGYDIAAIPSLVKPLVGNTTPDAVVQPDTEEELKEFLK